MSTSNIENKNKSIKRVTKIFKNRFGHFRAGWRILFYITFVVTLYRFLDLLSNSLLLIRGENLSDYLLLLNRSISKFLNLLSVFIPSIVLLKWVDKRPVTLLGTGFYKGAMRELFIGMLMGFLLIILSVSILRLTGVASFSFNGLSIGLLLYLLGVLIVLVISAAYEEVLFRGYVFQALIEGSNFWITLAIFSLLFGAAHIGNTEATVYTVAVTIIAGVFVGTMYFKTRTLWICIGVHFMWNWTLGPLFGMGLSGSKFLKRSIFTYKPSESGFFLGADAMSEIILGIVVIALTIYIWKANWFKPAEFNKKLWALYPSKYGTEPEMSE